ncbi:hypothetical protein CH063_15716 [Colletotrichum higginsianum]|uniref:Uncharacterized protein n=1 Tax=Colletotrichum higginsianum (strain IMI 349063) TaxID=759273 RepID=H1W441_COLHI|nr:hypothetical protein CH063_15716 [Colletotrichum higginsianum]
MTDHCCISSRRLRRIVHVALALLLYGPRKFVWQAGRSLLSLVVVHRKRRHWHYPVGISGDFFLEGLEGGGAAGAVSFQRLQSPAVLDRGPSKLYSLATLLG